jgi:hypothetical protein
MVIVHRLFRRECALLPQLVAAVPVGDVTRAHTVTPRLGVIPQLLGWFPSALHSHLPG